MRLPRANRAKGAIQIKDDLALWRSDFDEPLPPVTRNELLTRLGLEAEETESVYAAPSRMSDLKAAAAA
jgi:hypothetical protein